MKQNLIKDVIPVYLTFLHVFNPFIIPMNENN